MNRSRGVAGFDNGNSTAATRLSRTFAGKIALFDWLTPKLETSQMFAFALSLLALCSVAGLLQFWSSRRWLSKSSLLCSAAFAAIVAALCLQGVTALVTAFGIANPDASFMGYFNQTGYITIAGAIVAVLLPAVVGVVIAFIPAALTAALLRPTAAQ